MRTLTDAQCDWLMKQYGVRTAPVEQYAAITSALRSAFQIGINFDIMKTTQKEETTRT